MQPVFISGEQMQENNYLIAGLGNPGMEYEQTRHNAGFMAADLIMRKTGCGSPKKKFEGLIAQAEISGSRAYILKPQTYMNLSGKSINSASSFYKIPAEKIIVIYDDFALPVGTIRIRKGGSDGGHNGITSAALEIGSKNFIRVRIGAGPLPEGASSISFVLSRFSKDDMEILEKTVLPKAAEAVEAIIKSGLDRAMNLYNKNFIAPPKEKKKEQENKEKTRVNQEGQNL